MRYNRSFTDSVLAIVFKTNYLLYIIILLSVKVYLESRISLLLIRHINGFTEKSWFADHTT